MTTIGDQLDDRFNDLEGRILLAETRMLAYEARPAQTDAPDQPLGQMQANLFSLAQWTDPEAWNLQLDDPVANMKLKALLNHLHGLVERARAGERIPPPTENEEVNGNT
jgi:hypothetical protein